MVRFLLSSLNIHGLLLFIKKYALTLNSGVDK
jgi:hypothetical protein